MTAMAILVLEFLSYRHSSGGMSHLGPFWSWRVSFIDILVVACHSKGQFGGGISQL